MRRPHSVAPAKPAPLSLEAFGEALRNHPATASYDAEDRLAAITYAAPDGSVTKTLTYDGQGRLIALTFSGAVPPGTPTTKTLTWDAATGRFQGSSVA